MNEEIEEQLKRLLSEGKISLEEKKKLEEAINQKNEPIKSFSTEGKRVNVNLSHFIGTNIEIFGKEDTNELIVEKGAEFVEIEKDADTFNIRPKSTYARKGISILGIHIDNSLFLGQTPQTLRILLPVESNIKANSVSGDCTVENLKGNINIKTVDGDIHLSGIQDKVKIESISGDLSGKKINGEIYVSLKSGDVHIKESNVKGFIKTYSGDARLHNVSLNGIEIIAFSGDITMDSTILNGDLFAKTFSGDFTLRAENIDARIITSTKNGDVIFKDDKGNTHYIHNNELVVGQGKYKVSLKTLSGDIRIEKIQNLYKEEKDARRN